MQKEAGEVLGQVALLELFPTLEPLVRNIVANLQYWVETKIEDLQAKARADGSDESAAQMRTQVSRAGR